MSKRDQLIGLRVSDDELAAAKAAAERTNGSVQAFLRSLLRRACGLPTDCEYTADPVH